MIHAKAIMLAGAVLASLGFAGQARAQRSGATQCNPPRPNLEYPAWYRECQGVLQARFRDSNPYQLPYAEFVRMVWQMYEVRYRPGRYPNLPGSPCSPEGSGYMNPSGHAQICTRGRWRVGSR
jgi:hypothetical protein